MKLALAIALLCPQSEVPEETFRREARRSHVPVMLLVAVSSTESACRNKTNPRTGATGPMQILPRGSADDGTDLTDVDNNVRLGARHLARWIRRCGSVEGGLAIYHGEQKCSYGFDSSYVREVKAKLELLKEGGKS